jgi:hypothetical protein
VLKATRRSADPLPVMLYAFAGVTIFAGQITGNGSINAYAWLFTGLCLAAARVASAPLGQRIARVPVPAATSPVRRPPPRAARARRRAPQRLAAPAR